MVLAPALTLAQFNPCNNVTQGFVPDPNDANCTTYWSCRNGQGEKQGCQNGFVFDRATSLCTPRTAEFECPEPVCPPTFVGIKHVPFPNSCQQYFTCANGQLIERDCGPGYAFDYVAEDCDTELKADCLVCPPQTPPKLTYYPDKKDCNGYYLCLNGEFRNIK